MERALCYSDKTETGESGLKRPAGGAVGYSRLQWMQWGTTDYSEVQCLQQITKGCSGSVDYNEVQWSTVGYSAVQWGTADYWMVNWEHWTAFGWSVREYSTVEYRITHSHVTENERIGCMTKLATKGSMTLCYLWLNSIKLKSKQWSFFLNLFLAYSLHRLHVAHSRFRRNDWKIRPRRRIHFSIGALKC